MPLWGPGPSGPARSGVTLTGSSGPFDFLIAFQRNLTAGLLRSNNPVSRGAYGHGVYCSFSSVPGPPVFPYAGRRSAQGFVRGDTASRCAVARRGEAQGRGAVVRAQLGEGGGRC